MHIPQSIIEPFEPHGIPTISTEPMLDYIEDKMNHFITLFKASPEYMITSPHIVANGLEGTAKLAGARSLVISMSGGKTYVVFRIMIQYGNTGNWRTVKIRAPRTDVHGTLME